MNEAYAVVHISGQNRDYIDLLRFWVSASFDERTLHKAEKSSLLHKVFCSLAARHNDHLILIFLESTAQMNHTDNYIVKY